MCVRTSCVSVHLQLARENEELQTRCESAEDGERESIEEAQKLRDALAKADEKAAKVKDELAKANAQAAKAEEAIAKAKEAGAAVSLDCVRLSS